MQWSIYKMFAELPVHLEKPDVLNYIHTLAIYKAVFWGHAVQWNSKLLIQRRIECVIKTHFLWLTYIMPYEQYNYIIITWDFKGTITQPLNNGLNVEKSKPKLYSLLVLPSPNNYKDQICTAQETHSIHFTF